MKGRNYITPGGLRALVSELKQLKFGERPKLTETIAWAAGNGDRSENADYTYGKKRLREIDRRVRFLSKRIESAEAIDPVENKADDIRFGATVTILDEDDNEKRYSIVGTDESDLSKNRISWRAPLAVALLRKKIGDFVTVHMPKGDQDVEILKVEYRALDDLS